MERSIGFEKTMQVAQYEPIKVFSQVNNIPLEIWSKTGFANKLYQLLMIESYKAIADERNITKQLRESDGNALDLLNHMETEILDSLHLENIVVNINITTQEKTND